MGQEQSLLTLIELLQEEVIDLRDAYEKRQSMRFASRSQKCSSLSAQIYARAKVLAAEDTAAWASAVDRAVRAVPEAK